MFLRYREGNTGTTKFFSLDQSNYRGLDNKPLMISGNLL